MGQVDYHAVTAGGLLNTTSGTVASQATLVTFPSLQAWSEVMENFNMVNLVLGILWAGN